MRTLYDAVDARDVPTSGWDLLAGYVNGRYQSYLPLKVRFPTATVVSIDVLNDPGSAQVLDIELGDAVPEDAPGWFDESLKRGIVRPTLYYSASLHSVVKGHMGARNYDYWIAAYGEASCPVPGAVAWQKQDHGPHGENIDISDVFDPYWPYSKPIGDDMPRAVRFNDGSGNAWEVVGDKLVHITSWAEFAAAGGDKATQFKDGLPATHYLNTLQKVPATPAAATTD